MLRPPVAAFLCGIAIQCRKGEHIKFPLSICSWPCELRTYARAPRSVVPWRYRSTMGIVPRRVYIYICVYMLAAPARVCSRLQLAYARGSSSRMLAAPARVCSRFQLAYARGSGSRLLASFLSLLLVSSRAGGVRIIILRPYIMIIRTPLARETILEVSGPSQLLLISYHARGVYRKQQRVQMWWLSVRP